MSVPPVRPQFQNGQRLTAERLSQAQEYLRQLVRSIALAPLSAGVAGGFELEPVLGDTARALTVHPGMVIDGKGRVVISFTDQEFTIDQITALIGGVWNPGEVVEIAVALDTNDVGVCGDAPPMCITEEARLLFRKVSLPSVPASAFAAAANPNSVEPWEDIDTDPPTDDDCRIVIGHAFLVGGDVTTTTFYRQGVSPRFGVIRNSEGTPSIHLAQLSFDFDGSGSAPAVTIPGMAVTVPTLFAKPVGFLSAAFGKYVQAAYVAPPLKPYAAGQHGGGPFAVGADPRVFEFAGGAGAFTDPPVNNVSELRAGLAGVAAVPCQLNVANGTVAAAGEPLLAVANTPGGRTEVTRIPSSGPIPPDALIGISAGPSYDHPGDATTKVAPVAVAGIVKVQVDSSGLEVRVGQDLTAGTSSTILVPAVAPGQRTLARAAQRIPPGATTPQAILAWVANAGPPKNEPSGVTLRVQPMIPISTGGDWSVAAPFDTRFSQTTVGVGGLLVPITNFIDGAVLTSVTLILQGSSGHLNLPAVRPSVILGRNPGLGGAFVPIATNSDASADVTAYESVHAIQLTGLSEHVNQATGDWYVFGIQGESGSDSQVGLVVFSIILAYDVG